MNKTASISYISSSYIDLTRTCHQKCSYCSFVEDDSPLLSIEQLKDKLSAISKKNATEVVFVSGETPQDFPHIQIGLHRNGFSSYSDYLSEACQLAINEGLLPTLSIGHVDAFLAERFASSGCLVRANLVCSSLSEKGQALEKSRGRNPSSGKAMIEALHASEIPYSIGFIVGIGEKENERLSFIKDIGMLCTADPYLQDIRIVPFQPSPECEMNSRPPLSLAKLKAVVAAIKLSFPVHHISIPPYLCSKFSQLIDVGINDLGSIPISTGDPSFASFEVPDFETLKVKLEKSNIHLFERSSLSTSAALNKSEISEEVVHIRKKIERRNTSGLNLIDNHHCFVCGTENQIGLHIPIKDTVKGNTCTFTWTAGPGYQGYAGIVHGGILTTLLDEAMVHAVMGDEILVVTADIRVRFLRPAPVGIPLKFIANRVAQRKHLHFAKGTVILPNGTVLAEAEGRFAEV